MPRTVHVREAYGSSGYACAHQESESASSGVQPGRHCRREALTVEIQYTCPITHITNLTVVLRHRHVTSINISQSLGMGIGLLGRTQQEGKSQVHP
jgi:hypothetical protein